MHQKRDSRGEHQPAPGLEGRAFRSSTLFRVVYPDAIESLERGASDLVLEGKRLCVRLHIAASLEVRFVFDVGGLGSAAALKPIGLEIYGADKTKLAGPWELTPEEWRQVQDSWAKGKERAFDHFVGSLGEKITDPWVNWEPYCRVVVPPILGGPPPTMIKILGDPFDRGGASDPPKDQRRKYVLHPHVKLSDWLDNGFCTIIEGFPVVISKEPGKFYQPTSALTKLVDSLVHDALIPTEVIARTWCPTIKEAALHMTRACLFANQSWDRKMEILVNPTITELYRSLERARSA